MLAPLLATSSHSDIHFGDVTPELAIAAAIAVGLWVLTLLAFAYSTRPKTVEPGAPTMDLREEPPALVDFLVNGCRSSDRDVAGTLLDLAARRIVSVEDQGDETVCRVERGSQGDLLPYEQLVFEHVAELAHGGYVPAAALTTGSGPQSQAWHKRFDRLVLEDARSRGLSEDRWSAKTWASERLIGLIAGLLVIAVCAQAGSVELGLFAVLITAASAHQGLKQLFGDQRLSSKGVEVASYWMGVRTYLEHQGEGFHDLPAGSVVLWDRYLALACVFGLSRTALKSLPMGQEDDHKAWSDFGGSWHPVRVHYPRSKVVWGRTPAGVLFVGILQVAIGLAAIYFLVQLYDSSPTTANDEVTRWFNNGVFIAIAVFGCVTFWGLTTLNLATIDLRGKREVQGRVVRCRAYSAGNDKMNYFVAVDDGTRPEVKAWLVSPALYHSVGEGDVVHAVISPRQCHVYSLDVTTPGPREDVAEAAVPETTSVQFQQLPGFLGKMMESLASGTAITAALFSPEELSHALGGSFGPPQTMPIPVGLVQAWRYPSTSGDGSVSVMTTSGAMVTMAGSSGRMGANLNVGGSPATLHGDSLVLMPPGRVIAIKLEHVKTPDPEAALRSLGELAMQRLPSLTAQH